MCIAGYCPHFSFKLVLERYCSRPRVRGIVHNIVNADFIARQLIAHPSVSKNFAPGTHIIARGESHLLYLNQDR